jgi:hypothetical protein
MKYGSRRFYVYELSVNGQVFYVGKGTGNRLGHHYTEARSGCGCRKCAHFQRADRQGLQVKWRVILETDDEAVALAEEYRRIRSYPPGQLANRKDILANPRPRPRPVRTMATSDPDKRQRQERWRKQRERYLASVLADHDWDDV